LPLPLPGAAIVAAEKHIASASIQIDLPSFI